MAVSVPQSHLAALRFLDDLGFERFGIRATLAHGNPGDKGERARLKKRGHLRPKYWSSVGDLAGRLPMVRCTTVSGMKCISAKCAFL